MKKGIEILVIDKDTGLIKHRVRESFDFPKDVNVNPNPDVMQRFESFAHGFIRLFHKDSNCVIQLSCQDLPEYEQKGIFVPVSNKRCQYVY